MNDPAMQLDSEISLENFRQNPLSLSVSLTIRNPLGLHARAAGKLVKAAADFKCQMIMVKDSLQADVRSIVSLIALGCPYNTEVTLLACGEDAAEAIDALSQIVNNRFGEA
jgi:phosphocarrier protein